MVTHPRGPGPHCRLGDETGGGHMQPNWNPTNSHASNSTDTDTLASRQIYKVVDFSNAKDSPLNSEVPLSTNSATRQFTGTFSVEKANTGQLIVKTRLYEAVVSRD